MGRLRVPAPDTADLLPVYPGEIDVVQFTQVRNLFTNAHGYQENEVDTFLDRCAATIAGLMRENDALHARVERAERKLVSSS